MFAALDPVPGGIAVVPLVSVMSATDSCASFFVESSLDVACRSASVTRPDSAVASGGSPWHAVQLFASIVSTSHGTPAVFGVPPLPEPVVEPEPDPVVEPEPEPVEVVHATVG